MAVSPRSRRPPSQRSPHGFPDGELPDDGTVDADDEDLNEKTTSSNLKVFACIAQGARLPKNAERLESQLDTEFCGEMDIARENEEAVDIGPGLTFTVVSPTLPELEQLHKKHQEWLVDLEKEGLTPEDALAAYVVNRGSSVFSSWSADSRIGVM